MMFLRAGLLAAISLFPATSAMADDWTADKLRGQVLQLVNNQWVPLRRGDVVPDTRFVATMATGHVELTRGGESVSLDPNTRIRIFDKGGAKPFTTVKQDFGVASVEANIENVQHFAVQTQYLAAVVKGTRFTVTVGKTGAKVDVRRGHVEVDDPSNHTHTTLSVGQSATVDKTTTASAIVVSGTGSLPEVLDKSGVPVASPDPKAVARSADQAAKAALKAAEDAQKTADELGTKTAKDAAKEAEKIAKDAAKVADKADRAAKNENSATTDGGNGNGNGEGNGNGDGGDSGKKGGGGDNGNSGSGNAGNSGGGNGGDKGNSGNGNGGGSSDDSGNHGGGDGGDKGKDKGNDKG